MGVSQLETFMRKSVPDGTKNVSIKDECEAFQSKTGNRPTLIIDLMGTFNKISEDKIVELCGGRHKKHRETLEDLFTQLTSYADLVFFVDGPTPDEKMDECNRRRNDKYDKSLIIIDAVYNGLSLSDIVEAHEKNLAWAPTFQRMLEATAKKYGKLYVTVTKECDTELARYACNNPSTLAVVADDSDFLIFEGNWRYFSFKNINSKDLTTLEYNRSALRTILDLNEDQMKTLSTLAGNDVMNKDEAKKFHFNIKCPFKPAEKFPFLANYVKNLPQKRDAMVKNIAESFNTNKRHRKQLQTLTYQVEDSLELYNTVRNAMNGSSISVSQFVYFFLPQVFQIRDYSVSNPVLHFCATKYFDFCYKVLKDLPDNVLLVYYDLRTPLDDTYVESILNLFARQIGVLMQHNCKKPGGVRLATCVKMNHTDKFSKHYISPVYPEHQVPDLMEFLNRQDYPELDDLRFDLLKWMISEKLLASHDLTVIPKNYLLDVITLCFMVDKKLLSVIEADLILYTIKKVELDKIPDCIKPPEFVHPRAFKLSFLFLIVTVTIQRCFEVVGFKDAMKIVNFDGVFFHHAFLKHANHGFNPTINLTDLDQYRLYKEFN